MNFTAHWWLYLSQPAAPQYVGIVFWIGLAGLCFFSQSDKDFLPKDLPPAKRPVEEEDEEEPQAARGNGFTLETTNLNHQLVCLHELEANLGYFSGMHLLCVFFVILC